MAQSKHTPGPWEFRDGYILANGRALKVVGVQVPMVVGPSRLEAIHNARLIAAAPELLAAMNDLLDKMEGLKPIRTAAARRARAVIAKAEGGAT